MEDSQNPFRAVAVEPGVVDNTRSNDLNENLEFTARIVKLLSVCCALGTVYGAYNWCGATWYYYQVFAVEDGWQVCFHVVDGVLVFVYAVLAWRGFLYGKALSKLVNSKTIELEDLVECQTWVWLGIALFVFLKLVNAGLLFSFTFYYTGRFV